jgi:ankyrin repeat protein
MDKKLNSFCRLGHINKLKKHSKYLGSSDVLRYACYGGHLNVVNFILDHSYKNNYNLNINYGLKGACWGGHLNLIHYMVSKGADAWNHALASACWGGHIDLINLMISKGANNWNWGLQYACYGGHKDTANLMIQKGATELTYVYDTYTNFNVIHLSVQSGIDYVLYTDKSYVSYLFNLSKFDRSMSYLLEDLLHQNIVFNIQKYL